MNPRKNLALFALFAFFCTLISCGGGSEQDPAINHNDDGYSDDKQEASTNLVPPESEEEFITYIKTGLINASSTNPPQYYRDSGDFAQDDMANVAEPEAESTGGSFQGEYSTTNLQEVGVDESDIVKNDGNYAYVVESYQGNRYYDFADDIEPAVNINASDDVTCLAIDCTDEEPPIKEVSSTVHIHKINNNPASSKEISTISLKNATNPSIFLANTNKDDINDTLVAVSNQSNNNYSEIGLWYRPWYWSNGSVNVSFINIEEPSTPVIKNTIQIDGHLIKSRRIGNKLYLVTKFTPHVEGIIEYPENDKERSSNKEAIGDIEPNNVLPKITNNDEINNLVNTNNCFIPASDDKTTGYASIITITAIDIANPGEQKSICYAGQADGFYASTKALYLTVGPNYNNRFLVDSPMVMEDEVQASSSKSSNEIAEEPKTTIYKFALLEEGPQYRAAGKVTGHLNWRAPSFRMGEKDDAIGIVTSTWSNEHQLTFLKESTTEKYTLEVISKLPNKNSKNKIGKPGEDIYSTRFLGNRLYVVTFERIDPLYVIDITDTTAPVIAGELEIPGYSSYIHPVTENLILGIGKDAYQNEYDRTVEGGIKLSLFDVSDANNPLEVKNIILGDRGSSSPSLSDHHAVTFLRGSDDKPHKLAIPVSIWETGYDKCLELTIKSPDKCMNSYPFWAESGLYMFDIDASSLSIKQVGSVITSSATNKDDTQYYYGSVYNDRAIIQGDAVHYIHERKIISDNWHNF